METTNATELRKNLSGYWSRRIWLW